MSYLCLPDDLKDARQRANLVARGQGMFAQTFDREIAASAASLVAGSVYYVGVPLLAGDVVTTIYVSVTTAATVASLSKVGLYDKLGNRLALSADLGAAWQTVGTIGGAMIAPYGVSVSGLYYLAVVSNAAGLPAMIRGAPGGNGAGVTAIGSNPIPYAVQLAQVDLPATGTIAASAVVPLPIWMGIS